MTESLVYRVRFRFRVRTKLNIPESRHSLTVEGREVVLSSPQPEDVVIRDSEWLLMNARGFQSEQEARDFGQKLRSALDVASAVTRLGLDSGVDSATASSSKLVKDQAREHGVILRDNVHGIDVFPDDPRVAVLSISASGSVLTTPTPFLSDVGRLFDTAHQLSERGKKVVILLNYALMRADPVAQSVFALSAVEMLGQEEKWNATQKALITKLAAQAAAESDCTAEEREEVVEAVRKGLHKLSLRQGVLRLLASLGLRELREEWDAVYAQRSALVHGLDPKPGVTYDALAARTLSLCGRILLHVIAREIPSVAQHVETFYERVPADP